MQDAMQNILAEREQKDKRIQELELKLKCSKDLYADCCKCLLDSIPKQVVIDKIEEINNNKPYLMKFNDWREKEYTNEDIIDNCVQVLQELLEGGRK